MPHRFLIPAFVVLAAAPAAMAAAPALPLLQGPGGTVFVAGGHVSQTDADLWGAFAGYARAARHEKRPKVVVFCTARDSLKSAKEAYFADSKDSWGYRHIFEHYGLAPVFVPIAIDNFRQAASAPQNLALLEGASAVWFGGGAQNLHARCLLNDDGTDSPLMKAVRRVVAQGGIVGGTSAGAAIMDRFTYGDRESYDYLAANSLMFRPLAGVTSADSPFGTERSGGYTHGFNFLSAVDAAVDTHTDARGRYGRVLVAMRALKNPFGLAIAEDTALAVKGKRGMAYGAGTVFVADGRRAAYGAEGPYSATGVSVSLLRAHDAFDFESGAVTASVAPWTPKGPAPARPADVLAKAGVPDQMAAFARSGAATTSFRAGAPLAFDFVFDRAPETRVFVKGDHVAVDRLKLTVTPETTRAAEAIAEAALKAKAQAYYPAYVADLEHLTNIDSGSGDVEGSKQIADWLDSRLSALGATIERVDSGKGTHVIARFKGTGKKRLLLMAHTDTVFVKGDAAKRPFRVDAQNRAYGPGVGDDKATCLQVLYTMRLLKDFAFDRYGEITLYFDAEEETGSPTGEAIIARLAKQSDACLVMDTARPNWGIVAKRKGFGQYVLTVTGRSGHAGNAAHHSASATMQLGQMLARLYKLASPLPGNPEHFTPEGLAHRKIADHGQFIPANTINVGVVSTPNVKFNVIPDQATVKLDVRCFDRAELTRLDKAIREMAAHPVVPGTLVKVEGGIIVGPQEKTPQVETLIATYKAVAKRAYGATVVEWQAGGISDGNVAAQHVPTIDALGIEEYDEHTDREWVDLTTVVPRTVVLVKYLEALSN